MGFIQRFKRWQFRASRWLLHVWIRPTVLGANTTNLELADNDHVCYVLPFRSIADLLVTDKACEDGQLPLPVNKIEAFDETRSFFFLGHPEGTFGRRTLREQSDRMVRLFDHQTTTEQTIKIVPVSLFWGHQPDREQSIWKLVLSENWSVTSRAKKFFAGLFHRSHILVQFGKPIHLNELMASEEERARQIRKLHRLLRVHFNHQKLAIIGPDLSHRNTLINTILGSKSVRAAIDREARQTGNDFLKVEKKATAYAEEIASDQSYRVIRFFDVLLTWLWNNLYDGIEVNGIDELKQLAQSHEVVYIPCHRSHIDYLLLSYVLYHNGLTPPHIAAGENLNLPIIGGLLRRAGAFYMRRSFKGDALYKEVFDEYLHQMFTKGYSVEYFIEGGRSRTGRTLPPRTGMLSMTVSSFQKDASKPIVFMPVYFGYERVLESSTYLAELSGKDKESESVFDVFSIFSSFKHEFGQVTVNFGEPVQLKEFLDETLPNWATSDEIGPTDFSNACLQLATDLATRINTAVAIKSTNLVALAMLSSTRQSIEESHLTDQIHLLQKIAMGSGHTGFSITTAPVSDVLEEAMEILGLTRTEHRFGNIISAGPIQAINMTYNANNVLHIYALPSLVARFVRTNTSTSEKDILEFLTHLFPFLRAEMFLPWDVSELPDVLRQVLGCLAGLQLIRQNGNDIVTPSPETREYSFLQDLATISDPTMERFYIVLALLKVESPPTLKGLESLSQGIAEQLSVLYGIQSPDFFQKSLFTTFISTLKDESVVTSELARSECFDSFEANVARTLDADVRYNILQAVSKR